MLFFGFDLLALVKRREAGENAGQVKQESEAGCHDR
jgi:hypothetical protein